MFSRFWLACIAFLWTVAIVVGSFLPGQVKQTIGTETQSSYGAEQRLTDVKHHIGHLVVFGIEAFLLTAASRKKSDYFYCFLITALLGLTIEYMQYVTNGYALEWWDVGDDTLAAAIGCKVGSRLVSRFSAKQPANVKETIILQ